MKKARLAKFVLLYVMAGASVALVVYAQKANTIIPAGARIPMRAGQLDCVGFPDYNSHALHASCTTLGENRMYGSLDLSLPVTVGATTTGRLGGADWVEFSLTKESGANRWSVLNNLGQKATGTF